MSSLLVLQDNNNIILASDTAASVCINGTTYRASDQEKKIFNINGYKVFASGQKHIRDLFVMLATKNESEFSPHKAELILKKHFSGFDEYCLEVVIAEKLEVTTNLYIISSYDNFNVRTHQSSGEGISVFSAGIRTKEVLEVFDERYGISSDVIKSILQSYTINQCEEVGGSVEIHQIGSEEFDSYRLPDIDINRLDSNYPVHLIVGERIMGKILIGTRLMVEDENGIIRMQGSKMEVFDKVGNTKVILGEYETGKYGLRINNGAIDIVNGLPENQIDPSATEKWNSAEEKAKAYTDEMKGIVETELGNLSGALDGLDFEINTTFKDGIIDKAEVDSIERYINLLNNEKAEIDSRYNVIYANSYLKGVTKTTLANTRNEYNTSHTNLTSAIMQAIADGKATAEEKLEVDSRFADYKVKLAALSGKIEDAINFIAQSMANTAESNAEANAKKYTDEMDTAIKKEVGNLSGALTNLDNEIKTTFKDGIIDKAEADSIATYIKLLENEKNSIDSRFASINANPFLTGATKSSLASSKTAYNTSHANLIVSISTAIADSKISVAESLDVDAKFTDYRNKLSSLSGKLEESVAFIAQSMANTAESNAKMYADEKIGEMRKTIESLEATLIGLEDVLEKGFRDGIIGEAAAISIGNQLLTLSSEKADVDEKYRVVYANPLLAGAIKSSLFNAKNIFNNAYSSLVSGINLVVTKKNVTPTDKTIIDGLFANYRASITTLSGAFEEAVNYIAQAMANKALDDAKEHTDGKDRELRTDLRLTATLPTSIKMDANGITATAAGTSGYARLDHRGLYINNGAIDIRTGTTSDRGVLFDAYGIRGYNASGIKTFEIDNLGNAMFSGRLSGATGTFSGSLSAASGTFGGTLSSANGTFTGNLSAVGGTFSGTLSAAGGTFKGDISAASGTFTGKLSGNTITGGTITGSSITGNTISGGTINGTTITGVTMNSGTINIGSGIQVGNYINIGDRLSEDIKYLYFNNGGFISGARGFGGTALTIHGDSLTLQVDNVYMNGRMQLGDGVLDLEAVSSINWGTHKPDSIAKWG